MCQAPSPCRAGHAPTRARVVVRHGDIAGEVPSGLIEQQHGMLAAVCKEAAQVVGVVALVAEQFARWRDSRDQRGGGGDVGDIAAGQQDGMRAALGVAERVDLGGAPTARAADRLVAGVAFTPLFAPAAERCAFTAELSIIVTCGGSAQATRIAKMRCHSPRWLQRFQRLKTVVYGPYSGGKARQRQPSRSRWMMPLITRRSSTRRGPVWTIGRCGSIAAHCTSFTQNRRDTVHPLPFGKVNHRTAFTSIGYRP